MSVIEDEVTRKTIARLIVERALLDAVLTTARAHVTDPLQAQLMDEMREILAMAVPLSPSAQALLTGAEELVQPLLRTLGLVEEPH